jgi:predicted DCC family thiol-disulfide oxidoreductase YuxK
MIKAVHVRRADGSVATGFDAWLAILGELDGWGWFATAAGRPWLRWIGSMLYAAVARWRHRLAGLALLTRRTDE